MYTDLGRYTDQQSRTATSFAPQGQDGYPFGYVAVAAPILGLYTHVTRIVSDDALPLFPNAAIDCHRAECAIFAVA